MLLWMSELVPRAKELLELSQRQIECSPKDPFGYWDAAQAALWLGEATTAIEYGERGMEVAPHSNTSQALLLAYVGANQIKKGSAYVDQRFTDPDDEVDGRLTLAAIPGARIRAAPRSPRTIRTA